MAEYVVVVPGKPQGKGRPRFARQGRYIRTYTPKETLDYERKFAKEWKRKGYPKLEGPLQVEVYASMYIPKNTSKKERERMLSGEVKPTKKPDWDNLGKITDFGNGVAWKDDSQIVIGFVKKFYDVEPYMLIKVKEL